MIKGTQIDFRNYDLIALKKGIKIYNGYGKSKKLYYDNSRIKELTAQAMFYRVSTNTILFLKNIITNKYQGMLRVHLSDTFGWQEIKIPKNVARILTSFKITDVYHGKKYNDICVSEIDISSLLNNSENINKEYIRVLKELRL